MKNLGKSALAGLLACGALMTSSAQAALRCPSANAIKSHLQGPAYAELEQGQAAYSRMVFLNNTPWILGIAGFSANSTREVEQKGQKLLSSMSGQGHEAFEQGTPYCAYQTADSNVFVALIALEDAMKD